MNELSTSVVEDGITRSKETFIARQHLSRNLNETEGANHICTMGGRLCCGRWWQSECKGPEAWPKTNQQAGAAGLRWEWGKNGRDEVREVGGRAGHTAEWFFHQHLCVTREGGRKTNLFLGAEIIAKKAMLHQELPVQFPKWNTFKVEDLRPK